MRRLAGYFTTALITFGIGVSVWSVNPTTWSPPAEPLRVTITSTNLAASSKVPFDHYLVTVENVSSKTVRGYSLGRICNCIGWDDDGNYYPRGINFAFPNPERQVLRPGESQTMPFPAEDVSANEPERRVWVDLVHFKGMRENWGPNQSRRDGYLRE